MYDVNYFIRKFEAIPESQWINNATGCAYTICGQYRQGYKSECPALSELFRKIHYKSKIQLERDAMGETYHGWSWIVCAINDDGTSNDTHYKQKTPKKRILAALYDIRDKELSEANVNAAKEIIEVEKLFEIIEPARS